MSCYDPTSLRAKKLALFRTNILVNIESRLNMWVEDQIYALKSACYHAENFFISPKDV